MTVVSIEDFLKQRGGGVKALVPEAAPPPVPEAPPQAYLLTRVLEAALVHKHVLDDPRTAEELLQAVRRAFTAGELVVFAQGRLLQNIRAVLSQNLQRGEDPLLAQLYRRLR